MAQLPSKSQSRLDVAFQFEDLEPILDTMRNLMTVLEARFQQAEIIAASNEEQADILVDAGLARINEVLLPLVERIQKLTSLGFLVGASATSLRLELAQKTFTIVAGDQRDLFTPSAFVTIERVSDFNTRAIAKVLAYDKASGQLAVQILTADGDGGLHNDWLISCSPAASLASTQAAQTASTAAAAAAAAAAKADADATMTAVDRAATHSDRLIADDRATAAAASAAAAKASEGKVTTPIIYGADQLLQPADRKQAKKNIGAFGLGYHGNVSQTTVLPASAIGKTVRLSGAGFDVTVPTMAAGEELVLTNNTAFAKNVNVANGVNLYWDDTQGTTYVLLPYTKARVISIYDTGECIVFDAPAGRSHPNWDIDQSGTITVPQRRQLFKTAGLQIGTAECRLQFTDANTITLVPSEVGNQVWLNGRFITIPSAGISLPPTGMTINVVTAIYLREDGTLQFSTTQPTRGIYGTFILGSDETMRHVGDVIPQTGVVFAANMVASRYNRRDYWMASGQINPSTSSTAWVDAGGRLYCLVPPNERVDMQFRGIGYNFGGASGNWVGLDLMSRFGSDAFGQGGFLSRCHSNQNTYGSTFMNEAYRTNGSVSQQLEMYGIISSSGGGTGAAAIGHTVIKVKK